MDSINLKYLRFNVLQSTIESLRLQIALKDNKLSASEVIKQKFEADIKRLETMYAIKEEQQKNNLLIHENEVLYYKEKAKGKFTSFLLGTTVGAILVALISLL